TPHALTSIYFYHHPAWRPKSPGVFSILQQVAYAQQLGLTHQYQRFIATLTEWGKLKQDGYKTKHRALHKTVQSLDLRLHRV
ncbi:hypothetical protein C2W62_54215, partial [Candidatus Entotheonella serta]